MDESEKDLDMATPETNKAQEQPARQSQPADKKVELKEMASAVCTTSYAYVAELKNNGHASLGNLIFQEMMTMNASATLASESIGRDRFLENLEEGFYSSGKLLVYLNFAEFLKVNDALRTALVESVTGIHKIYAASVKTVKSKQRVPSMTSI